MSSNQPWRKRQTTFDRSYQDSNVPTTARIESAGFPPSEIRYRSTIAGALSPQGGMFDGRSLHAVAINDNNSIKHKFNNHQGFDVWVDAAKTNATAVNEKVFEILGPAGGRSEACVT